MKIYNWFVKIIIVLFCCGIFSASGANVCVRSGATGNGSDWNNALSNIPSPPIRGNTYWIADGNYSPINLSSSGTNFVIIKKATALQHGTDVGWLPSYGAGQAVWQSGGTVFGLYQGDGHFVFDGYSPSVSNGYGFKIIINIPTDGSQFDISCFNIDSGDGRPVPDWTFRYIDMVCPQAYGVVAYPWVYSLQNARGFTYRPRGKGESYNNITISHCAIRGFIDCAFLCLCTNLLVENNELCWSSSSGAHPNVIYGEQLFNAIWRYNVIHDYGPLGIGIEYSVGTPNGSLAAANWYVYGNVVYNALSGSTDFIHFYSGWTYQNINVYNNTIVGISYPFYGYANSGTAYNNLFYANGVSSGYSWGGMTHDYNWYQSTVVDGELHGVAGNGSNPFLNYTNRDLHLASSATARNKGLTIPNVSTNTFSLDYDGNQRGVDGVWDIGAYEYASPASPTYPILMVSPSYLNFGLLTTNTSSNLTVTVQNIGSGALVGTAGVSLPFGISSGGVYNLNSNQSQQVKVSFNPTAVGAVTQAMSFTNGGGAFINLIGEGIAKQTNVAPAL